MSHGDAHHFSQCCCTVAIVPHSIFLSEWDNRLIAPRSGASSVCQALIAEVCVEQEEGVKKSLQEKKKWHKKGVRRRDMRRPCTRCAAGRQDSDGLNYGLASQELISRLKTHCRRGMWMGAE